MAKRPFRQRIVRNRALLPLGVDWHCRKGEGTERSRSQQTGHKIIVFRLKASSSSAITIAHNHKSLTCSFLKRLNGFKKRGVFRTILMQNSNMGQKSNSVMSYSVIQVVQRNKFISNFVLVAPWLRNLPTTGSQLERSCFMRRWKSLTLFFFLFKSLEKIYLRCFQPLGKVLN